MKGAIVRMCLQNFLTFESIECFPAPKLNLVIGPNGTGKSSLVCAIVLGLGGKPKLIGRAHALKDYIKAGQDKAVIEIELFNPDGQNFIIVRSFTKDNKSTWSICGEMCSQRQIENLMEKLDIQVDNLCQFLPQDRVQDFAKMNKQQLLDNTLKTVGAADSQNIYTSLKEMRKEEINIEKELTDLSRDLDTDTHRVERMENEVKSIKKRQEIVKNVAVMKQKRAWIQYDEKLKEKQTLLSDRKQATDMKGKIEEELRPIQVTVEQAKLCYKRTVDENNKLGNKASGCLGDINNIANSVMDSRSKIDSIKNDVERKVQEEKKRQQDINELEKTVETLEVMYNEQKEKQLHNTLKEVECLLEVKKEAISKVIRNENNCAVRQSQLKRNVNRLQESLQKEIGAANKKISILQNRFEHTYNAWKWLEKDGLEFKGKVLKPMMLEMNIKNSEHAKYFEAVIPYRDLIAFMCNTPDDMSNFLRKVRDSLGFQVNAISAPVVPVSHTPKLPVLNIKTYGFHGYLIDEIEAPDKILDYLCKTYNIHNIPFGGTVVNTRANEIPSSIKVFFSNDSQFIIKISKYSREAITKINSLKDAKLLLSTLNHRRMREIEESLSQVNAELMVCEQDLVKLREEYDAAVKEKEELMNKKKDISNQHTKQKTSNSLLQMKRSELEQQKLCGINCDVLREQAVKKTMEEVKLICSKMKQQYDILNKQQSLFVKGEVYKIKVKLMRLAITLKEAELISYNTRLETLNNHLSVIEDKFKQCEQEIKQLYNVAYKMTDNLSPKDRKFKETFHKLFQQYPHTIEEIDIAITNHEVRAECMSGGRSNVLEEYEKCKNNVEVLKEKIRNYHANLENVQKNIDDNHQNWMPQIVQLIDRINKNYQGYFAAMGCVGEVSLFKPENERDYHEYGIQIRVKFRDEETLQDLGPHKQSGGERAVSTAVYMLSLQKLTRVPFRCIDEINQGMDKHNERLIFTLLVHTVEEVEAAQCFLLTPKLLNSLQYTSSVQVMCIYSGEKNSLDYKVFSIKGEVDRYKQQKHKSQTQVNCVSPV